VALYIYSRTLDLPAPKRTHFPVDHGLVSNWSLQPRRLDD